MPQPSPRTATFSPDVVRRAQLDNGLTVIVLPDPLIPSVAYSTTYRVGSRNERPGITGMSHLFEHLMFGGARKYGPGAFDRVIEGNGGYCNAFTTVDVTSYYELLPSDRLGVILDLERDRMVDLELSERTLQSEREVVKEERRSSTDESPVAALHELLHAAAFLAHPYRWPVIGWMADVNAITLPDLQEFFERHYHPGNAVVAVAGAVDPQRVIDEIAAALGDIPAGPPQPHVVRSEPEQRGERRVTLRREAQLVTFFSAFHACEAASRDLHATDVLQSILTDGDSSRLWRRLVHEDDLAVDVSVDFPWTIDPGLFVVETTVRPGVEPARAEAAVADELGRIAREPPTSAELRKAKNQLKADLWRRLKTNEYRAERLATMEILSGSHEALFALPDRYEAVTEDDVGRIARSLFRPENRTVAILDPIPDEDADAAAAPESP